MKHILLAAALAVLTLTLAPAATAQSLEEGMWTGTMTPPGDGDGVDIGYEVKMDGDVLMIALVPPADAGAEADRYEFSEIRMEDGNLVFWWQPGPRVDCVLEPIDGGGFEGECSDSSGDTGILSMHPPGHDDDGHEGGHDNEDGHDDDEGHGQHD